MEQVPQAMRPIIIFAAPDTAFYKKCCSGFTGYKSKQKLEHVNSDFLRIQVLFAQGLNKIKKLYESGFDADRDPQPWR